MTTTTAMTELATRHLASGASRLAGALSDFLIIAFGVAMGRALVSALAGELALDVDSATLPVWAGPLSLALAPLAFAILFRVPTTQWAWVLIGSAAGLVGSAWGASFMGPTQGAFLGALVVGVIANAYARGLSRPASTIALPGLLMLVPGSLGYRAMGLLMARDVEAGLLAAVDTAVVAVALVAGSLAANAVLSPRRGL